MNKVIQYELQFPDFEIGLNAKTAKWINEQEQFFISSQQALIKRAFIIGKVFTYLTQQYTSKEITDWFNNEVGISPRTLYDYKTYYENPKIAEGAKNVTEVVAKVSKLRAEEKQKEKKITLFKNEELQKTAILTKWQEFYNAEIETDNQYIQTFLNYLNRKKETERNEAIKQMTLFCKRYEVEVKSS